MLSSNSLAALRTEYVRNMEVGPTELFSRKMLWYALKDIRSGKPALVADARDWILSESFEPTSFLWCCHCLSQDPNVVRSEGLFNACRRGKRPNKRLGGILVTATDHGYSYSSR